jgi:hypothetical protein
MVPPPRNPRLTVSATERGVARLVQSKPQQVHSTGVSSSRRAAASEAALNTP